MKKKGEKTGEKKKKSVSGCENTSGDLKMGN